ncbi:CcdB family protein [Rhizobium sp. AG855]|uniref:CcdB family protein n=1 Tax=Rhizobium sp. AG855 TaxID=2183898 RepID=UPI000E74D7C2|nr:CcdB family protein [Rhizobium sp. AG855]RKE86586.1 toxin CcdB [Rhizobium sp. AG855]
MTRFHVHRIGDDGSLALDVQSNLLDALTTRVVVPLAPVGDVVTLVPRLNARLAIDGETFAMLTQFITTVPVSAVGPAIADLSARADEITAATDFLFQGF